MSLAGWATDAWEADAWGVDTWGEGVAPTPGEIDFEGVIAKTTEKHYYRLTLTERSRVEVETVLPDFPLGNLDSTLAILDADGEEVYFDDPESITDMTASLDVVLDWGTWYIVVGSHGSPGDVGQYQLIGTVTATVTLRLACIEKVSMGLACPEKVSLSLFED